MTDSPTDWSNGLPGLLPNHANTLGRRKFCQLAIHSNKRQTENLRRRQYLTVARVFMGEGKRNRAPSDACRYRHYGVPGCKLFKPCLWRWRRNIAFRDHAGDLDQGHVAYEKMCLVGLSKGGGGNPPEHGGREGIPNRRMGIEHMPHAACQSAGGMTGAEGSKSFTLAVPVMEPCTIFETVARGFGVFFTAKCLADFGVDLSFIASMVATERGVGKGVVDDEDRLWLRNKKCASRITNPQAGMLGSRRARRNARTTRARF